MSGRSVPRNSGLSEFWNCPPKEVRMKALSSEEIIIEGDVYLSPPPFTILSRRHLYLTPSLLCYSTVIPTQSFSDPRIRRSASAPNLRILPFEDHGPTYGLKISTDFNTFVEVFVGDREELEVWCDALSLVCFFTDLDTDYKLLYKLGAGSYSEVFAARDLDSQRDVAIKRVRKGKWKPFPEKLLNEIAVLRSLHHPGIVPLIRVYEECKEVCLVQALIPGVTLQTYITAHGPLSEDRLNPVLKSLLQTIRFMHSSGVLHRDVKPENVIVDTRGGGMMCTLIDFGFAIRSEDAKSGDVCGTPGYIAPELLKRQKASNGVDIFSLGIVACTLIRGQNPFAHLDKETTLHLNRKCQISFDPSKWPKNSSLLLDLLRRMTAKEPSDRPSAADCLFHPWFTESIDRVGEPHRKSLDRFHYLQVPNSEASTTGDDRSPLGQI